MTQVTKSLTSIGSLITSKPWISAWCGGVALSAALSLQGNPTINRVGDCGLTSLLAVAVASNVLKRSYSKKLKASQVDRSQLETDQRLLEDEKKAVAQSQTELNKAEAQLTAFQAKLKSDKANLDTRESTYKDRILIEQTRLAETKAQKAVDSMQAKLEAALADKAAIQSEYSLKMGQVTETAKKAVAIKEEHTQKLTAAAEKAIDTRDEVLINERGQVNGVLERLSREISSMAQELSAQKEMVAKLQAPKTFQFNTYEAQVGNKIQSFLNGRGVILSCRAVGDIHYGKTPIFYEAINCDLKEVETQLEPIQLHLGLPDTPTAVAENGFIKLTVQLSQDKSGRASTERITIKNPPLKRLEGALDSSIHVRVVAPSNSGKTALLGNLINYSANTYLRDYTLSDPKVTAPENWGNLKPDYYSRECLDHYFNLTETALQRIDSAAEFVKKGLPVPKFEPQFHIIDELEFLYGLAEITDAKKYSPKLFKTNTKAMLKVGREHKMKMLFVTQSPLPAELNLRKDDLENCSSIFLGSAISRALSSTDDDGLLRDVPSELIAKLKAEYQARLEEVSKLKIGKPDDFRVPQEFIYLFFNPAKPRDLFFGLCPTPGHYAALAPDTGKNESGQNQGGSSEPVAPTASTEVIEDKALQGAEPPTNSSTGKDPKIDLAALLAAGTLCPNCGTHCNTYKIRKPNKSGKVTVNCKNKECNEQTGKKSFPWKVV